MIYSDKNLAQKLERTEARSNADFVEARARMFPESGAEWTEIGGAYAMFDGAESPLTQTFGLGMFDDFFSRFFSEPVGVSGGGGGSAGGRPGGSRAVEQTDITQLFSDATRDLLQRAAQTAAGWGSLDLDTDHLLHGALSEEVVIHVLEQAGADPKAIAAQIEDEADRGKPVDVSPSLTPDAKRAILTSYEEARELGASYIGPEHILLALARDEDTQAGEILRRFGLSHTALRGQVVRGVVAADGSKYA